MSINEILEEREKTHGSFKYQASYSQCLKGVARMSNGWKDLSHSKQEAIEMILHKVARVLNGNSDHADHWDDIAGYAALISNSLREDCEDSLAVEKGLHPMPGLQRAVDALYGGRGE